jgi:flagellar basal-body rod modification protein FlgD
MTTTMSTTPATTIEESTKAAAQPKEQLASKEAFLQLLVSQIKNQNPLNPTDGVQFLSQLAQFSELEQLIGVRSDLTQIRETLGDAGAAPATDATSKAAS